jgi:hypothetical protein
MTEGEWLACTDPHLRPDDQRDVFPPVPQGRQLDRDHRQPVVKVLAKLAPGDTIEQVPVGGGDDADVTGQRP